jgi:hypothetical protein
MNYTTIDINGQKLGLKFGMASFRYLQGKFVDGIAFQGDSLNEIGIAHILYSGYFNNCLIKDVVPTILFEDFVDFIELNLNNEEVLANIKDIMSIWAASDFVKQTQVGKAEEPKKKTTRGKK